MEKHQYEGNFLIGGKYCPRCREKITPADVEMFSACPYCNKVFTDFVKVEELSLQDKLRRWVVKSCRSFTGGKS